MTYALKVRIFKEGYVVGSRTGLEKVLQENIYSFYPSNGPNVPEWLREFKNLFVPGKEEWDWKQCETIALQISVHMNAFSLYYSSHENERVELTVLLNTFYEGAANRGVVLD